MAMRKLNRILQWGIMLWKRLYKKATFLLLMLIIPFLVIAYNTTAQEDSGVITVALAHRGDEMEPLTRQIWDDLQQSELIYYIECDSPETARELVRSDKAQTAWIFDEDLEASIYDFIANRNRRNAFLTIVEPKDRTLLKMMREVLSGTVFAHCTDQLYLQYLRENAPELNEVSDQQLLEYYHNQNFQHDLFVITDVEGNIQSESETEDNYLLAPVRGMLAVVVALAALATALYYIRDEESGTFALVPLRARLWVELGCQLISIVNILIVVIASLAFMGSIQNWSSELLSAGLYALCTAAFAMLVRRLCVGIRGLGMATPILVVVMLVLCPVFFDLAMLRQVQLLLPPTYFVFGIYSSQYLLYMGIYVLICLVLCRLLDRITHKA